MYSYSSDSFLKLGDTWVRSSRVESVKREPANSTALEKVIVTMLSGEKIRFTGKQGEAKRIIDLMATGEIK